MMITKAIVLALMAAIHPDAPGINAAPAFADAIALVVERDALPAGWDKERAAAALAVYGWAEGRYAARAARGDHGRSVCAFQVRATSEVRARELEASPIACARAAYATMRASVALCDDLSGYCGACRGRAAGIVAAAREGAIAHVLGRVFPGRRP